MSGNKGRPWGLAASLAAATALGAHTAHVMPALPMFRPASMSGTQPQAHSPGGGVNVASSIKDTNSSSTNSSTAAAAGGSSHGRGPAECSCSFANCNMCSNCALIFTELRCLELGWAPPPSSGQVGLAVLADAAQQKGATPQQYLQEQLLALALRHPVPGVWYHPCLGSTSVP